MIGAVSLAFDRASYRNRRGFGRWLITRWKALRHGIVLNGDAIVIKASAEFWMTEGAILEIGANTVIQNYAFFQLTKPSPKVVIGSNTVIGRHCIITAKNSISIGHNVLMGAWVQVIDHNHSVAKDILIREQRAEVGTVTIEDDVWIGVGAKILSNVRIGKGAVL